MKVRDYVTVIENNTDKKVVDSYEKLYQDEIIGLEIVKPSEQSFKTLFTSNQRGGAILLLNQAVGRQEQDNLNFLSDHKLLPNQEDQYKLFKYAFEDKLPSEEECQRCIKRAAAWRALKLANDPKLDSMIINWCIKSGIFKKKSLQKGKLRLKDQEIASNGVQQLWNKIDGLIK